MDTAQREPITAEMSGAAARRSAGFAYAVFGSAHGHAQSVIITGRPGGPDTAAVRTGDPRDRESR